MSLLIYIIFGGLVGWVASILMKTDGSQGIILNVVVGIVGAVLGSWIMNSFGEAGVTSFNLYSFLVALIGAMVLLAVARFFR
jgi:uncharacterized membrane protein YeaQ/YmgE (transglycosylase-associated protein family)